ncbi:hypothetical protein FAIPA1_150029 [Frankia sp. AiPs1]|uniref:GAF domain-containing protein n=1 Tax=Frankia sp. AiPa1 TaxID=573492 RepID=UPI00202B8770|nr:GAF domain-containing protein [Frankia sp. AiPa1]MCL9761365.1 GAF domain-containing protein [Frankia sp. AiPa1]
MITDVAQTLVGADDLVLLLSDTPGSTIYRVFASRTLPGCTPMIPLGEARQPEAGRMLQAALHSQGPLFLEDARQSPLINSEMATRFRLGSVFLVPLPGEGGLLGAIAARWTESRSAVDPVVVRALTLLARQSAHTLVRLRASEDRMGLWPLSDLPEHAAAHRGFTG